MAAFSVKFIITEKEVEVQENGLKWSNRLLITVTTCTILGTSSAWRYFTFASISYADQG